MSKWPFVLAAAVVAAGCGGEGVPASRAAPPVSPATADTATPAVTLEPRLWRSATAPAGAPSGYEWIDIATLDGKTIPAAVIHPVGAGPSPVAVFLHGSAGLRAKDLELGAWLATEGFVAVAPCWAQGAGAQRIACDAGAPGTGAPDLLLKNVLAISGAVRTLPRARGDRLVLIGHSLGAWAAVAMVSTGGRADAVVSISGAYTEDTRPLSGLGTLVKQNLDGLRSPLLIVHGTKDDTWRVEPAQAYEKLALERGKKVEALYVDGAPHQLPFTPEFWTDEVRGKVIAFLRRRLP